MASKLEPQLKSNVTPRNTLPPALQEGGNTSHTPPVYGTFPRTEEDKNRLQNYDYYQKLFMGEHFEAFNLRAQNPEWSKMYAKLRYIKANFAGLISKVIADILFSEPITIKSEKNQDFLRAVMYENSLNTQLYESALMNSALGDDVFKIRVGPKHPEDERDPSTILIEEVNPSIYFPIHYPYNNKCDPKEIELAWKFKLGNVEYVRKEIHSYRMIRNKVFRLDGDRMVEEVDLSILGEPSIKPEEIVKIDRYTIVHIANWKTPNRPMGISDYADIDTLFFAINNRMTMIDNILDKHSDPILMVPPGILDEKGKVKKKALGVIEIDTEEANGGKPEYIVWDASLENAFKEVEKLVEMMFMVSETSPDILGMGQGQADSGRALKLKILRTIAKAKRKRLYYDRAIKEMLYVAQLMSKEYDVAVGGIKATDDAVVPDIEWQDGIPADPLEAAQIEQIRIDSGTTSTKFAIMRLDDMSEDEAEKMAKEIKDEQAIELPTMDIGKDVSTEKNTPEKNDQKNASSGK